MVLIVSWPLLVSAQDIPQIPLPPLPLEVPGAVVGGVTQSLPDAQVLEALGLPSTLETLGLPSTLEALGLQPALETLGLQRTIETLGILPLVTPEALVSTTLSSTATLTQQIVDYGLEASSIDSSSARTPGANAIVGQTISSGLSAFTISGVSHTSHDGFAVKSSSGGQSGVTPGFESLQYGLTLGVRADASKAFNMKANMLTFGLFGNAANADIDIGASGAQPNPGIERAGEASLESWSAGGYSLITNGAAYGLFTVIGSRGEASVRDNVTHARGDYTTDGVMTSGIGGFLIPLGLDAKLDLRGGLTYLSGTGDAGGNSQDTSIGEATIKELAGNFSVKFFSAMAFENAVVRPFAQAGVTHRLDYSNDVHVSGVVFSFRDADTTLVGRLGVDFDVANMVQGYVAVRGDLNEDVETVGGQLGLTVKMN